MIPTSRLDDGFLAYMRSGSYWKPTVDVEAVSLAMERCEVAPILRMDEAAYKVRDGVVGDRVSNAGTHHLRKSLT